MLFVIFACVRPTATNFHHYHHHCHHHKVFNFQWSPEKMCDDATQLFYYDASRKTDSVYYLSKVYWKSIDFLGPTMNPSDFQTSRKRDKTGIKTEKIKDRWIKVIWKTALKDERKKRSRRKLKWDWWLDVAGASSWLLYYNYFHPFLIISTLIFRFCSWLPFFLALLVRGKKCNHVHIHLLSLSIKQKRQEKNVYPSVNHILKFSFLSASLVYNINLSLLLTFSFFIKNTFIKMQSMFISFA